MKGSLILAYRLFTAALIIGGSLYMAGCAPKNAPPVDKKTELEVLGKTYWTLTDWQERFWPELITLHQPYETEIRIYLRDRSSLNIKPYTNRITGKTETRIHGTFGCNGVFTQKLRMVKVPARTIEHVKRIAHSEAEGGFLEYVDYETIPAEYETIESVGLTSVGCPDSFANLFPKYLSEAPDKTLENTKGAWMMNAEKSLAKVFGKHDKWIIEGDELSFLDDTGEVLARFHRVGK